MPEPLPVAPSLSPSLREAHIREPAWPVTRRVVFTSLIALALGGVAALIAEALRALITLITNLAFYGRWSLAAAGPVGNHLGWLVVIPPVLGGIVVGLMARFGSAAIRGHGIPEAMEQVLFNRSRIPARVTLLKPLSAAVAIGTGGPFGAEGPIIATGGALGSLIGQIISVTAMERKVLLAAGAAAGMAATFGTPVAAVLLAVEFLLFEFRARSIIPVALACVAATAIRIAFRGAAPVFDMPLIAQPGGEAVAMYVCLGAVMGLVSVFVTRAVYDVEDAFEHIPVHWMWWPAIGGIAVGVIGKFLPSTMGVGYDNIDQILGGVLTWKALAVLGVLKLISWAIALGSGTSGGTLAPLFTVGGAFGSVAGVALAALFPHAGVDPRMAALVGMASMFSGASHAMLTWVVFAFETTRQPVGLLPLLGGCAAAYLVSMLRMRYSIMTEKIARRGTPIARGYEVDHLRQQLVKDWASTPVVTLKADDRHRDVSARMLAELSSTTHQGFPVLDAAGALIGVVTLRDLFGHHGKEDAVIRDLVRRAPVVAFGSWTLREAADEMVRHDVGRLPVVDQEDPRKVVGIITRSDLLRVHATRLSDANELEPSVMTSWRWKDKS